MIRERDKDRTKIKKMKGKKKRYKDCEKMRARKSEIKIWRVPKEEKQMVKKALIF